MDQEKKQAKSILVKRGLEWHAPDFMQINTRHVVLVEPVAPESQMTQIIRHFKKGPPPAAPPGDVKPPAAGAVPEEKRPPAPSPSKPKKKEEKGLRPADDELILIFSEGVQGGPPCNRHFWKKG